MAAIRQSVQWLWSRPRRGVLAAFRGVRWLALVIGHWIAAQALLLWRSPLAFYRAMGRRRDWLVAKIEYAHTESAKWRGMWVAVKAPYTVLRACGLNPQAAIARQRRLLCADGCSDQLQ